MAAPPLLARRGSLGGMPDEIHVTRVYVAHDPRTGITEPPRYADAADLAPLFAAETDAPQLPAAPTPLDLARRHAAELLW